MLYFDHPPMTDLSADVVIPDRPTFRTSEVCELLKVQPYVLRSWESEFADLGVSKTAGAPRVYRRIDVELALRIRQLVFGEGLTLAGVRRRLEQERPTVDEAEDLLLAREPRVADAEARVRLERARQGLRGVLDLLTANGAQRREARPTPAPAAEGPSRDATSTPPGENARLFSLEPPRPHESAGATAPVPAAVSRRQGKKKADAQT
jgi:DNA-binding transcriptional MerR regulator